MNGTWHCPLSRCETDPGYCEETASTEHIAGASLIVIVPILIALLAPLCARSDGRACFHDDDSPQAPTWSALESPIDPPMFLCGLGLLPLDCGISGLLTVVSVMVFAFTTVFFSMLTSERPCSTALGRCRTISCVCGTMLEGYVFMFCMLSITSVLLVQRFSRMVHHHRIQHRTLKPTLIVGSLMLTLTGIFPQRYDVNDRADSAAYGVFTSLHLVGIFGAGALLLCVPFFWFAEHWYTHRRRLPSERVPLRSLIARAAYFFAICGFSSAMLVFGSDYFVSDQVCVDDLP